VAAACVTGSGARAGRGRQGRLRNMPALELFSSITVHLHEPEMKG
jgi:hypothetical protein